ncbi:uracil-DNA glycosylase [Actinospica robiniae]|uniref:uracil-DNA glycosylase n=1 Tax=Actinospica robiniae TaxID=304901 RepID=UPI000A034D51|nr:uracil-DNA glycosylase [Actinospica robiniae]
MTIGEGVVTAVTVSPLPPAAPAATAAGAESVAQLDAALTGCRACPRLVAWREEVGQVKRRAFAAWDYWSRPVPGLGPATAPLVIVGLAPAAHGGNRTGRAFTGDPAGDVLFAALHDVGLATHPTSTRRDDGTELVGVRITMPVHCAPPDNKPTTAERDACRPWLVRELELMRPTTRAILTFGGFAWQTLLPILAEAGWRVPRPRPAFGHGAEVELEHAADGLTVRLIGCFHPSHRNIATRTLTPAMLRAVLAQAALAAGLPQQSGRQR